MSQSNVERVVGRLVTDEGFRRRFAESPAAVLEELTANGMELTDCEMRALSTFDARIAARCARAVDPRIQKADLHGGGR